MVRSQPAHGDERSGRDIVAASCSGLSQHRIQFRPEQVVIRINVGVHGEGEIEATGLCLGAAIAALPG